jgi:hypothetical protein
MREKVVCEESAEVTQLSTGWDPLKYCGKRCVTTSMWRDRALRPQFLDEYQGEMYWRTNNHGFGWYGRVLC